jgi:Apea-like HEPN/ApeA N-terminal domain 1
VLDVGDGPLSFVAITVAMRHLEQWIGQSSVRVDMRIDDASNEIADTTLTIKPIKPSTVATALGELKLEFSWRLGGDHLVESTVRQDCTLRLQPASPVSLDELLKPCLALQHLVTLGVDETAPITALRLAHSEHTRVLPSGEVLHTPIDVYARLEGGDTPVSERRRLPHGMLFTFDDLGGLPAVARWLDVSTRFGPVTGALLGHRYLPRMYGENRLQNAVFAAETFDRLRFPNHVLPKADFRARVDAVVAPVPEDLRTWLREQLRYSNEPRLRDRLKRLADHAGSPFATLVGDVDAWVTLVARTRNQAVVHRNSAKEPEGLAWSLYLLSESAYFLVALCLLRECGAPVATIAKIPGHRRSQWLSEQLQRLKGLGGPNTAPRH